MLIIYVTTVPVTFGFLTHQMHMLRKGGFEVHAVSSPGQALDDIEREFGIPTHAINMQRRMTPLADLRVLYKLWRLFRLLRPDIVSSHTPKAGLLSTVAALLAGVSIRVFTIHGLPHIAWAGWRRWLLKACTSVTGRAATRVLCVSNSMQKIAIAQGLCSSTKSRLIHNGGSCGIDAASRFNPDRFSREMRASIRAEWGVPEDAIVVCFVGRVVREKGLEELAAAFQQLEFDLPMLHVVIAGTPEAHDAVSTSTLRWLGGARVHQLGWIRDTAPVYAASDILVLPSYREGYPNVILEASAMELPVIASAVPGCTDAVVDGATGTLVQVRNAEQLAAAIRTYVSKADLRIIHGRAGRERVLRDYRPEDVCAFVCSQISELVESQGRAIRHRVPLFYRVIKRFMEAAAAALLLFLLLPVLLGIGIFVRIALGGSVLFRQERTGAKGRLFSLLKFRTMRDALDTEGRPLPDEQRLTGFGRILRASSLDELPELWNVLKGDMSLVGPRPLLPQYLSRYTPEQRRRHEVKPGITGWAQVNGRNSLSWEKRFELDVWYVDNRSLALDLKILWMTLLTVLRRSGVSADGHATMPEFQGTCGTEQPS